MKLSVTLALALLTAVPGAALASAQAPAATTAQEKAISEQIARRIAADDTLTADAVKVTVEGSTVTLSGLVANAADKAKAERLARVDGVTRVVNNLKTREGAKDSARGTAGKVGSKTKQGAEKTVEGGKKVGEAAREGVSKTGEKITDGWITSRIKTKYMASSDIKAGDINVDTKDHVVTLTGTVPSAIAHARAIEYAKEVEGVKRVVDNLKIVQKQ